MTEATPEGTPADDRPALEALIDADPADAPDIAEGLAAGLQRELDQTGHAKSDPTTSTDAAEQAL